MISVENNFNLYFIVITSSILQSAKPNFIDKKKKQSGELREAVQLVLSVQYVGSCMVTLRNINCNKVPGTWSLWANQPSVVLI